MKILFLIYAKRILKQLQITFTSHWFSWFLCLTCLLCLLQISDAEKLKIAQFYLMSSPPGQFHEILSDVRKILPENLLADSVATGVAHNFNLKNNKIIISPGGNKVISFLFYFIVFVWFSWMDFSFHFMCFIFYLFFNYYFCRFHCQHLEKWMRLIFLIQLLIQSLKSIILIW